MAAPATTQTQINPNDSLRQKQLSYNPVETQSTFNPASIEKTDMSMFTPQDMGGQANVFNQRAATGSGGKRLDFQIDPQSVMENAMAAFQSQLPSMNIDFADQSDQLAKRTARMGRTGSALFNRDTGYISDRARAARESLLGNLGFQGAQADQGADLQAQITRQNLLNAQEGRMSQASIANAQMKNQMAAQQAANAMNAMLQNQSLGANMSQFNALQDMGNQQFNIGNQIGQNQFGAQFDVGQQAYQNQLAGQAQNDLYNQMMLFGQGFQNDPTQAMMTGGAGIGGVANMFGDQAGMANQGIGGGAQALWQMLMGGGGVAPQVQPSQPSTLTVQPFNTGGGVAPADGIFAGQTPGGGLGIDPQMVDMFMGKPSMNGYDSYGVPFRGGGV